MPKQSAIGTQRSTPITTHLPSTPLSENRSQSAHVLSPGLASHTLQGVPSSTQGIAWKRYLLLLTVLVATSLFYSSYISVGAQAILEGNETTPNGTIPPGGTIPPPTTDPTQGQVRVFHLAPFAAESSATAIDICETVGSPVAGLTGLVYLENSGYITVAPGTYDWAVGTPGCTTLLLDLPPFVTAPGSVATILVTGGANNQPLTSVFIVDELGQQNQLYLPLIHR